MKKIVLAVMGLLLISMTACHVSDPESKQESAEISQEESAEESQKPSNIGIPFEKEGFSVTFHKIEQEGKTITIELTLLRTEVGENMNLTAKERFRLIAADKQITYLSEIYDMDGNSLLGTTVETDQPIHCLCVFHMAEGFEPHQFRFVYDLFGFRYINIEW